MQFSETGLNKDIQKAILDLGFTILTPVFIMSTNYEYGRQNPENRHKWCQRDEIGTVCDLRMNG